MRLQLSPLESAVLKHMLRDGSREPRTENLEITSRHLTPCGRFVELCGAGLKNGSGLQVIMDGMSKGLTVDLRIDTPGAGVLEIVVNGGESWDGQERSFQIIGGGNA
jgi:hypothetical protein